MSTPPAELVLCGALVLSELISALENISLGKRLAVFRRRAGRIVDLGRFAAAALLVLSFVMGSDTLLLLSLFTLGSALFIETIFESLGLDAGRHAALFLCIGLGLSISSLTHPIGYLFLVVNILAMYSWSGIFKLKSRAWRRGDALPNVLASRGYGLNRWPPGPKLSHRVYRVLSWGLMLLEVGVTGLFLLAGETLTINLRRYANQPTLAFPWDRGWMVKK